MTEKSSLILNSIGVFKSEQKEPYQAGRQPDELGFFGQILLNEKQNFEQALTELESCSHIWVIFGFHHNTKWNPMVLPPRANRKIGVFATRSPYRPNPIGISLVQLIEINSLNLTVGPNDLLDKTPIYDIKPYHPDYDVAENPRIGWLQTALSTKFKISFSPMLEAQIEFLETQGVKSLRAFIIRQLEYDPTNTDKKRVSANNSLWTLAYRTWRIDFTISEETIGVLSIRSGYTSEEIMAFEDPYSDKKVHRVFKKEFG